VPGSQDLGIERAAHLHSAAAAHVVRVGPCCFCQIVATRRRDAASEGGDRRAHGRGAPRGTIYVDFLQNILGKTLATAYSARASEYAGVSTPLTWKEVDAGVDPREFTIRTAPARFRKVGDLWKGLRDASPQTSRPSRKIPARPRRSASSVLASSSSSRSSLSSNSSSSRRSRAAYLVVALPVDDLLVAVAVLSAMDLLALAEQSECRMIVRMARKYDTPEQSAEAFGVGKLNRHLFVCLGPDCVDLEPATRRGSTSSGG
jgi:hypothetical protein